MNHHIRRQDRKIGDEEAISILAGGEFGVLSMCAADGEPYAVPINYVLCGKNIYIHCAAEGTKLDCIRCNNRVSFCVVGRTEVLPSKFSIKYESAIAYGTAVEAAGEEKRDALMKIVEKYSPAYVSEGIQYINKSIDRTAVIKILIDTVTGKARRT